MKLGALFDLAVELAIKNGPKTPKEWQEDLKRTREEYDKLDKEKKAEFDMECLENPFTDSRIEYGSRNMEVRRILAGIDVDVGELLVARELSRSGKKIDAVVVHHPEGKALIGLSDVMPLQEEVMARLGVPINVAEKLLADRISRVARGLSPVNHYKVVDAARLLDVPLLCLHTVADNQVHAFLERYFAKKHPKYVEEVLKMLKDIPEYAQAVKLRQGPVLFAGSPKSKCGKVAITGMTGGTEGSEEIYARLAHAGVGTVIEMHQSEKHKEAAEKAHLNIVIAGHMSSDSLGMNLILDHYEKKGVEIVPCGGLIRVSRC